MGGNCAGDAHLVLKTSGTARSGLRLRLPPAKLKGDVMWLTEEEMKSIGFSGRIHVDVTPGFKGGRDEILNEVKKSLEQIAAGDFEEAPDLD